MEGKAGKTFSRSARGGREGYIGYGKRWGNLDERKPRGQGGHTLKSRSGFRCCVRTAKARPSNTAVRELVRSDAYTGAVPALLRQMCGGSRRESWARAQGILGVLYGLRFLYVVYGFVTNYGFFFLLVFGFSLRVTVSPRFPFPLLFCPPPFSFPFPPLFLSFQLL